MGKVTFNMTMSLDGFVAGQNDQTCWKRYRQAKELSPNTTHSLSSGLHV